jgi:phytoene dehydrogenase-like protein
LKDVDVIIVGAGLAGLTCARRLMESGIAFVVLEADDRIGGRLKTDKIDGFLLNHGFQVLQTAYLEACLWLDFERLGLKFFAPGAIVRVTERFHHVSDPLRRTQDIWSTVTAPIGSLGDRLRIIRLDRKVCRENVSRLFQIPDMPAIDFLRAEGFSEKIIQRFFKPFFAGVCLDPEIKVSSRVFQYIFRIFATGGVALPSQGMESIARQLAEKIPDERIRTGARVESIREGSVRLASGEQINSPTIVLATEGPETSRLLEMEPSTASRGETCLYFAAKEPPLEKPYLILNGNATSWVNSLTIPSIVAPTYAPAGQHLISVVVLGHLDADDVSVETTVRKELTGWFGPMVNDWLLLKTYRVVHALPDQPPSMPNPTVAAVPIKPGIFVSGEFGSVPGIQWAMLSGRHAAEAVMQEFGKDR